MSLFAEKPPVRPLRQLALWGTIGPRLRGLVDVLARDDRRASVLDDYGEWLDKGINWDVLRIVRPQIESTTPARIKQQAAKSGWMYAAYSNIRSTTYQLDLPTDEEEGWAKHLGSKARKVMRWELRKFAEHGNGRIESARGPEQVHEALDAVERLLGERWASDEVYFTKDPEFRAFVHDAVPAMVEHGGAWVTVARDDSGIKGVLISLAQNGWAMALTIAITTDDAYKSFSLGKHLFDEGLAEAVRRGCHNYDFLPIGGYKESFWHATPRHLESAMVGRGVIGKIVAPLLARRA